MIQQNKYAQCLLLKFVVFYQTTWWEVKFEH